MSQKHLVHSYRNFRDFLRDHAEYCRRNNPRWSYGVWARRIGLSSTASLTKILQGQRTPNGDTMEKLVRYFEFGSKEGEYFRDLIRLEKANNDPGMRIMILEKIARENPDANIQVLEKAPYQIIGKWYVLAIREMIRMPSFVEDPVEIAKKFHFEITAEEVKAAIHDLLAASLLTRNEQGKLVVHEGRISTTDDVAVEAIRQYHEQTLSNAKASIRKIQVDEREFGAASLVIKRQDLARAKEYIRRFQNEFAQAFECDQGDSLYQIQIQFYPLCKRDVCQDDAHQSDETTPSRSNRGPRS